MNPELKEYTVYLAWGPEALSGTGSSGGTFASPRTVHAYSPAEAAEEGMRTLRMPTRYHALAVVGDRRIRVFRIQVPSAPYTLIEEPVALVETER